MDYNEALAYMRTRAPIHLAIADEDITKGIDYIKQQVQCDDITAKALWLDLQTELRTKEKNIFLQAREDYKNEKAMQDYKYQNNAECPYCHSKNTKKISGISKAGSVALWGVFAVGKVSKQWHCNSCKSDF